MHRSPKISKKHIVIGNRDSKDLCTHVMGNLISVKEYVPFFAMPNLSEKTGGSNKILDDAYLSDVIGNLHATLIQNIVVKSHEDIWVIFVGLSESQFSYLSGFLPYCNRVFVRNKKDFNRYCRNVLSFAPKKFKSEEHIYKKYSKFHKNGSGLAVIEKTKDTSSLSCLSYAISVGMKLEIIDQVSQKDRKIFEKDMKFWFEINDIKYFDKNKEFVLSRLRNINVEEYDYVTFFTNGLPYGFFLNNLVPMSHIDIGSISDHTIFNSIFSENNIREEVFLSFTPLFFDNQEGEEHFDIEKILNDRFLFKNLIGESATIENFEYYGRLFPYSVMHIASHGSHCSGNEIDIEFKDRDGKIHHFIVDQVVTFGLVIDSEMIEVKIKTIFRIFDDKAWGLEKIEEPQYVFKDAYNSLSLDVGDVVLSKEITEKELIADSQWIKCIRGNTLGVFQNLASGTSPFIFNNSCYSGLWMARNFFNAGAKGYIGALWNINIDLAKNSAINFYKDLSDGEYDFILESFYSMNQRIKDKDQENIYIYWGLPCATLISEKSYKVSEGEVIEDLLKSKVDYGKTIESEDTSLEVRKNHQYVMKWLDRIINEYRDE